MRKTILVVASVALAMVVLGGVAWAATIQCPNNADRPHFCFGTQKADTMQGTKQPEQMSGKSGADTMYGRGKNDEMLGSSGPDKMYGGRGRDTLRAGPGVDRVYGQVGADHIFSGNNAVDQQNDLTDDYFYGGAGVDRFSVGGTNGVDRIYGGTGNDGILVFGNGATGAKEIVECGPGFDNVTYDEGVDVVDDTCEAKFPRPL